MILILTAGLASLLISTPSQAFSLTLAWDANTEPDLAGYKIYIGTESGQYSWNFDVGNRTTGTLENLVEGMVYYITLTAYNSQGIESGFSNQVRFPPWAVQIFIPLVGAGSN